MNFKNSMPMLQSAIEAVGNIGSYTTVISNGQEILNPKSVQEYTNALSGLSQTQARVALSTTSLTNAQKAQVLESLKAASASTTLNAKETMEIATKALGNKETAQAVLVKSGLITT